MAEGYSLYTIILEVYAGQVSGVGRLGTEGETHEWIFTYIV